jgi:hypothetical protein
MASASGSCCVRPEKFFHPSASVPLLKFSLEAVRQKRDDAHVATFLGGEMAASMAALSPSSLVKRQRAGKRLT